MKFINNQKIRKVLFIFWIVIVFFTLFRLFSSSIPLRDYPQFIAGQVSEFGIWAPVVFVVLFMIRPLIFFPATILSLSAGVLFGTTRAVIILIIAENLSSLVSYSVGKYFGKEAFNKLEKGSKFFNKFEDYIENNGFVSVLILRLVYAPFDLVGYFAGASDIRYKDFAIATFIGILPGLLTSAFLGGSVYNIENLLVSIIFFILGLVISRYIKRQQKDDSKSK